MGKNIVLTIRQTEELQEAVVDFLANAEDNDYSNKFAVLQKIYENLYNNKWHDFSDEEIQKQIQAYEALVELGKASDEDKATLEMLKSGNFIAGREVQFSSSQVSSFFTKEAEREADYRKINRELSELIKTERVAFDDTKINNALATIGDCYGIDDKELKPILALFSQIRLRLSTFKKAGCDIRKIEGYNDFGIMPAFYGDQGCGKSAFASIISKVVGLDCEHGIDDILGNYGTKDVFYRPLIVMNEFGRQNKNNLDLLKSYINGEVVTVNKKFKDPIIARCFASFILTSNFDPEMLKGTELGSRRICVIHFNNKIPTKSLQEIEDAVRTIWDNCDETTFEKFFGKTKEDLARDNLAEQTETEIEEFRSYLDDDAVSYLSGKLLRKQVRDYLSERYRFPMTYVDSFLKQDSLFKKIKYSKSTYYKLITM